MLKNSENIALQNLSILYTFLLRAEICTTFKPKWCKFPLVIQKYTKLANFARLYFPYFSTFRDQILHFYYFSYALFSCSDGFCFSFFNKNLAKHWNCPLVISYLTATNKQFHFLWLKELLQGRFFSDHIKTLFEWSKLNIKQMSNRNAILLL